MDAPLVLYSAATWVAYAIAERFYGGVHYAWCGAAAARHVNVPPTSSPAEIYQTWAEETRCGDLHSRSVEKKRQGILRGAQAKLDAGAIAESVYREVEEVEEIVAEAKVPDFRPVLFVIPFERVKRLVQPVPVVERAHPMSVEYRIEHLPRGAFDVLEIRR